MSDGASAEARYLETTSIDVERGGVRIRIEGIPARTNPVGGEPMIIGPLALEIDEAIESILTAIERRRAGAGAETWAG